MLGFNKVTDLFNNEILDQTFKIKVCGSCQQISAEN